MMHARGAISASSCERAIHCPGSVQLNRDMPSQESPYAARGTALHSILEYVVQQYEEGHDLQTLAPLAKEKLSLEGLQPIEWEDAILPAFEAFCALDTPQATLWTEVTLKLNQLDGETQADLVWLTEEGGLIVADYKFGNALVSPKGNLQLMFYACAAIDTLAIEPTECTLAIIQPSNVHSVLSTQEVSLFELQQFREVLLNAAERAYKDPFYATGSWCHFCRGKVKCPEFNALVSTSAKMDPEGGLTPVQLRWALDHADRLREWCDDVKALALREMTRGVDVPGKALAPGRKGRREWKAGALTVLQKQGLTTTTTKTETLSPRQFELNNKDVDISKLVEQRRSGPRIVDAASKEATLAQQTLQDFFNE